MCLVFLKFIFDSAQSFSLSSVHLKITTVLGEVSHGSTQLWAELLGFKSRPSLTDVGNSAADVDSTFFYCAIGSKCFVFFFPAEVSWKLCLKCPISSGPVAVKTTGRTFPHHLLIDLQSSCTEPGQKMSNKTIEHDRAQMWRPMFDCLASLKKLLNIWKSILCMTCIPILNLSPVKLWEKMKTNSEWFSQGQASPTTS